MTYDDLIKVMDFAPSPLTAKKTLAVIDRDQSRITGFVLTGRNGETTIVNSSAVRWLSGKEMWELMHGNGGGA
jgi:hypothetical protein